MPVFWEPTENHFIEEDEPTVCESGVGGGFVEGVRESADHAMKLDLEEVKVHDPKFLGGYDARKGEEEVCLEEGRPVVEPVFREARAGKDGAQIWFVEPQFREAVPPGKDMSHAQSRERVQMQFLEPKVQVREADVQFREPGVQYYRHVSRGDHAGRVQFREPIEGPYREPENVQVREPEIPLREREGQLRKPLKVLLREQEMPDSGEIPPSREQMSSMVRGHETRMRGANEDRYWDEGREERYLGDYEKQYKYRAEREARFREEHVKRYLERNEVRYAEQAEGRYRPEEAMRYRLDSEGSYSKDGGKQYLQSSLRYPEGKAGRIHRAGAAEVLAARARREHISVKASLRIHGRRVVRRFTLRKGMGFLELRRCLLGLFGVGGGYEVRYLDEFGDLVTVSSDNEAAELFRVYEIGGLRMLVIELINDIDPRGRMEDP